MAQITWWGFVWFSSVAFCLAAAHAQAGTIRYVNNASPTCQEQAPCYASMQAGIDAAQAGDTVRIQAGTYTEQILIQGKNAHATASEADRIVIEADAGAVPGSVVLHGAVSQCTNGYALRFQQSHYLTIRGLTITGAGGQAISLLGGINENSHIHIERNRIFGNGSSECSGGITINRGNLDTLIVNNLIYQNGRDGILFLDQDGGPHYLIENTIYKNDWNGVEVARNHIVHLVNNLIVHNGQASGTTGGRVGVLRENSTLPDPAGIRLRNNLLCGNRLGELSGPALDSTDSGNLTPSGAEGPGVSASTGCGALNTMFANVDGADQIAGNLDDDFALALSSPALDWGLDPRTAFPFLSAPLVEADYLAVGSRPQDGDHNQQIAFDVGAMEAQGNAPPIANAGPDQSVHVGETAHLDGSSSSDADTDPLTYQWTLPQRPSTSAAQLVDATTATPSLTIDKPGEYEAQLIVNDGTITSTPDTVVITTVNSPPVAHAGPDQSVQVGATAHLDGTASSDVDGDLLAPEWGLVSVPTDSLATLANATSFQPTFVIDKPGSYVVQLIVHDPTDASLPDTVTVTTANSAPVANAGLDQPAIVGRLVHLDGNLSQDADDDQLTSLWSFVSRPAGSTATLSDETIVNPTFTPDVPGTYIVQLIVNDGTVDSGPDTVLITTTENVKPVANAGPDQDVVLGAAVHLNGSQSSDADMDPLTYHWALIGAPEGSTVALSSTTVVNPTFTPDFAGTYVAQLIVNDSQLDSDPDTVTITVTSPDTTPPAPAEVMQIKVGPITGGQVTVTGSPGSVEGGARVRVTNTRTGQSQLVLAATNGGFSAQLGAQFGDAMTVVVIDNAGNLSPEQTVIAVPDPLLIAPPVNQTVATTVADATTFLYTGPNAIQTGVAPETIQSQRAAVVRGTVLTQAGNPLPGVTITVLNHPEFGQTLSRTDGRFDLVVNGGGLLTVDYQKAGYLPAQRQVHAPWQDYASLPEVMLIPLDSQVTAIDLASGAPLLVAQGSVVSDANGARQATMLFPADTTATLVMPDGSTQPLTMLHVRATEYTVGANGPQQMPAALPPSSAYTYAVELSADEALAAGAKEVRFNQPIPLYVDNFVGFPVGTAVPVGSYDRQQGVWMPAPNGKVIKVLSVNGGAAQVDTNGDNVADDASTLTAVGITSAEQQQLAALYPAGRSLWRVSLTYFSAYDCNWPGGPPADAISPDAPPPTTGDEANLDEPDTTSGAGGITYQNQTLSQQQDLTGTPFTLAYQSSRTRGNEAAYVAVIPLTNTTIPPSVKRVQLEIRIAGQQHKQTFAPQPNLSHLFTWDGKDGYGRLVQGRQRLEASIEFVYDVSYQQSAAGVQQAFGLLSGVPLPTPNPRSEVVTGVTWVGALGAWDARAEGLGGWSLDIHHSYDPIGQTLYLGDGTQRSRFDRSSGNSGVGIKTFAGGGSGPLEEGESALDAVIGTVHGIAVSPDGSVYVADTFGDRVRRVDLDGKITTVAGGGTTGVGNIGAGADALTVNVDNPTDVALGEDGSLYIAAPLLNRVLRVRDGVLTVFAGSGGNVYNGEGNLATATSLSNPDAVVVASDGSVYLSDIQQRRVRRVGLDGRVYTVAGTGILGTDINIAARQAKVTAQDLAIGPDGLLYIATVEHVLRIDRDGILRRVAGNPSGTGGDGDPAVDANFSFIQGITVAPNNVIFIADGSGHRVRMVTPDGILITVAGTGENGLPMEGARPTQTRISFPQAVATGPDGSLYFSGSGTEPRVFRVRPALPGFSGVGDIVVASKDGGEAYVFSPQGKHLRTVNTLTNAVLYTFGYDSAGRLVTVTDANNNVTTIQRNANEDVTGMTGPYGQNNSITLDANGYLKSITNLNGETTQFSYTADGLLTSVTPPGQPASTFTYDSNGRLQQGSYPDGGSDTLVRSGLTNGYQVQHTTGEGTQTTYQVEFLPDGHQRRTNLLPDGTQQQTVIGTDGSRTLTQPDGMGQTIVQGPDPRFGMLSPTPTALNVTTPGGKNGALTSTRTATLSNPTNPLSLTSQTDTATFNGRTATRTYNGSTRTYTDTSPASRTRTTTLDTQGRVTQQQQGTLTPTQFAYDTRGRLSTRTQGTRSSTMTYDTLGRLATITDPANRVVHFQYDDAGRVTRQTLPDLREITYTYDPNGNVTSIAPPGRPPHVFTYTAVNQEKDYTAPSVNGGGTQQTQYTYNADRQLTLITRPDGQGVQLAYDSAGRLGTQTLPTGQITYGYAQTTGNLTSVATASGQTVHYTYDGSLLTQSQWTGPISGTVSWTYDNNYRKTGQSVNGGNAVAFTYDADDLLTGAGAMTLTRNSNGLLTGTTLENVTDTLTYTGFGEVATMQANVGATAVLSEQYTRDNLGRITQKVETISGVTTTYAYTYDTAGRLSEVQQNGVPTATYTYDANSNRLTGPVGPIASTYDAQDRLLTAGSTTYTYTPNGELLTKTVGSQTTTYTYDVLGNLLHVELPGGDQIDYLVDGENRRIGKKVNGALVQGFLYENQLEPVAELDGSGNLVSRFVYCGCGAGNIPQYMVKGGVTYRIIADHLGSPRLVVDVTTGAIMQRMDYDEFGTVILDTNPGFQPFGFAGGIYDRDTGLVRHGARDYDPETGRWTAKDPLLFKGLDANLYGYVHHDPINGIDPKGLTENLGSLLSGISIHTLLSNGFVRGVALTALDYTLGAIADRICPSVVRDVLLTAQFGIAAWSTLSYLSTFTVTNHILINGLKQGWLRGFEANIVILGMRPGALMLAVMEADRAGKINSSKAEVTCEREK